MPTERCIALAAVAQQHNLMDVEDVIAARCIVNPPAPIATLMPKNRVYLTSLSKAVAPGLRIGCLSAPPDLLKRQASIVGASAWTPTPISAELTTRWIEDGTAEKILDSRRAEAVARLKLSTAKLGHHSISA
ncbi:MAG: aminotransferase class I/II-fold pyridoxal phosphate-dependent enzyme, partial [Pseudomonadota bacterium]|nr:aminotransferase class I/II-fold pyridoxal phosphate-dependent enzyme [Pseudomonadota bacterium]